MLSTSVIVGLIAMLTWGIADFLQSIPVRKIGIYKTMFLSNFFGYILLLPIFFFRQYLSISFSNLVLLFIGGFFQAIAVKNFYEAMQTGEIAIVTPISASYPLVSVILFILFLGSKLNFITGIAIFILILGIVLTSTDIKKLKNIREAKGVNQAIIAFFIWGVEFFVLDLVAKEHILFGISFPETSYIAVFFFSSLFNGLLNHLAEHENLDKDYIDNYTEGFDEGTSYSNWKDSHSDESRKTRLWLKQNEPALIQLIETRFKNVRFFCVSSMGHSLAKKAAFTPRKVLDPMCWLLSNSLSFSRPDLFQMGLKAVEVLAVVTILLILFSGSVYAIASIANRFF